MELKPFATLEFQKESKEQTTFVVEDQWPLQKQTTRTNLTWICLRMLENLEKSKN